jgi:hypothetical protein
VLKKIFGSRRERTIGGRRELYNEELYSFNSALNTILDLK